MRNEYTNKGWTVLEQDLNQGNGGWYVHIAYKTSSTANPYSGYITDICASNKKVDSFTSDGRTYYKVPTNDSKFDGDLNRGSNGNDIYLYFTCDRKNLSDYGGSKRVMTRLSTTINTNGNTDDGDNSSLAVSWRNSSYSGYVDTNKGAGVSTYIFIHQHFTTQTAKWKKEPTYASDLTYNGNSQKLITYNPISDNVGYTVFRVNDGSWSGTVPTATNVGNYKVDSRLNGTYSGNTFADNSNVISKTVTINPPIVKATNLKGVFNQRDKKVNLSWTVESIPGNYSNYKWVVYRDGKKIAELAQNVRAYADTGFSNEAKPVYDVYYVSNFWDVTTRRDDTKASVTVNTTRTMPVKNLKAEQLSDRIVFTWTSDAYPKSFGHKFRIYVNDEKDPIYTLTPADNQSSFRWEHRTTDQHANRQNKVDAATGVPYTEEPLSACAPRTYRIEGVIGDAVLNTYSVSKKAIGEATKFYALDASKGVYEGSVKLSWHVGQQGVTNAKTYIIDRRHAEQENEAWETLTRLSSSEEYLFYTDATALPGVFYDYRVTVEDKCDDGTTVNSEMTNIGFAKSTGTVTGRIAYGTTGTAVQGVDVVMTMTNSEGSEADQYHSIYFADATGGVTWAYPSADYAASLFAGDFSIQMWLYPETFSKSLIAHFGGNTGLGMTASGQLTFSNGSTTYTFDGITLQQESYNHVALTHSGTTLTCYVLNSAGGWAVKKASLTIAGSQWPLTNASQFELGRFKGAADELRLWAKCLSEADVVGNYDHLLVGDEQQLETYWTFDEGLRTQFFDYSRDGSNYHKHHGLIGSNVQSSTLTPSALKLKAKTDSEGNYIIQGIPYSGAGTTYTVVPLYGVHEFKPAKTLLYVGNDALVHAADFEDVSSFPMDGHIYYAGTNIPVEGIPLYVDGDLQTQDGQIVRTDANGYYNISVPIGNHYVEAKLDGHTMVAGGRFPTAGKYHFSAHVSHDFIDSTLVNFVGRVSGGEKNDTLAVGFGASNNNIGQAKITLCMNNESLLFNVLDKDHSTAATERRIWKSDTTSINSTTWTGYEGSDARKIYIETDPATGEFSALLPPLKYFVSDIELPKNQDNIEFASLPQIDLTGVLKELTDSLKQVTETGDSVWNYYKYNTKMVKTYFAEPQLLVTQKGSEAFGEQEMADYAVSTTETTTISDIWKKMDDGSITYTYGYPVFARNKEYKFDVHGFEVYTNYDSGTAVDDVVPLNGQVVTIANEMSNTQDVVAKVIDPSLTDLKEGDISGLKRTQLRLDEDGRNTITFTTGYPNVTAPYTRRFSMTFERKNRTYSGQQFDGIVLGELSNGNNFITAGPDHVDMVLRDPPGANGKVTWKTGHSYTKISQSSDGAYWDESMKFDLIFGTKLEHANGIGIAVITSEQIKNESAVGQKGSYSWSWTDDSTFVYTEAKDISSSTGMKYVGAKGDVFIGKSHNYIVGTCRKLGFHREAGGIVLGLKEAVAINDQIATDFIFSTREIEETMIPKLIDTRNSLLEYMEEAAAKSYENNSEQDVYLTWKKPGEDDYGEEGTYVWKPGKNIGSQDMVKYYNGSVSNWKKRLADNEQDKIEAMAARDKYLKENRSFDGGTSYTYSERRDSAWAKTYDTSTKVGITGATKVGFHVNAMGTFGTNLTLKTEVGYVGSRVEGDSLDNRTSYAEFEYELNDGNSGTDFSVDIYKSPRGWGDIFVLRGGQSYNPYEGEVLAEYYEPEKKHVISYGTERMEQPVIRISTDGEIGATSATLTDIPAGGTGQFTLHLTNGTTTNQTVPFTYILEVAEVYNQKGLQILMDGVPANDRGIYIPAGETVKKVITVRQTDQSVLDYEDVTLWFESQYQPFTIYDECKLNVHFVPSSSPIDLAIKEPVLNNDREDGILDMKLSGFNRQFKNLKNVGVQYRFQGNTQWTDLFTWWVNPTDTIGRDTVSNALLPESGDLLYAAKMKSNLSFPEGDYEFRAFTTTPYGTENVCVYSDVITVIKDMSSPRSLYTPAPANGILSYGDQLAIEFNEDIVPGYVGDANVIVTAKLNNSEVNHDVAYQIIPFLDMPRTVNPVFLKGDFAMDFWLNWHDPGTILHQGAGTDNFALGIDDAGHVKVTIANAQFESTDIVPKDEWVFFALSYNAAKMTFDILAQYGTTTVELFHDQPVTTQNVQVVNYASDNHLYLGYIWADIHGLSLYNICHDVHEAAATKYQAKDNYIYGLANYWPMDEGHGSVAADTRHTHDFKVYDSWTLNNRNYSLRINKPEGAQADITRLATGWSDSYAIELWYNKSGAKDEVVFETNASAEESKLRLRYDSVQSIVLDYGKKSMVVASHEDFPDLRRWHHVALNVVRGQAASFYLDGQRTAVIAERDVPPIEGSRLIVGRNNEAMAFADELRIWHAALSESRLLRNIYNTIDTADVYSRGLVAYYPFEKTGEENGAVTKVPTMENMAPNLSAGSAKEIIFDKDNLMDHTPPLKNAPDETRLIASPVASERKVVINLTDVGITPRDIEGTTLNITVDRIHDLHGNTSLPIRWTAYVQQNTLKWTKDSVNIIKKYGDSHTFDVTIENKSGNTEYYTLYNLPQWLSLVGSNTADEVAPLSTKVLRFQVNPLVPVGNYEVTIGVQGNNQILEPLRVVMKVSGEKPQWTVDPTLYEHQMNYIGQVRIGGILIENSESMVAAFIDGECRGVASPEQVRGAAYVTMTVYGNGDTDAGKPVSFRIWDASAGIAYTDVNVNAFNGSAVENTFQINAVRGSFDQPVIWTKGTDVEQNLKLTTNWNWVALGVKPADQRPAAVFPSLTPWDVFIKDKTSSMIFCDGDNWVPENAKIQAGTMYKMKITPAVEGQQMPEQVPVTGEQLKLKETPVTLTPGWNWIGYTPLTTMTVGEALAAANPQVGDCVKSQHGIAFYSQNGWEGSLKALESGHGYMYNSTASEQKSFVYPSATATNRAAARRTLLNAESQSESQKTRLFAPAVGNYPDNMSMVIELKDGEQSVDTCEVAAYIGGECRGATRANGGLYYLIIAGEGSGQPLELRTCINGEMMVIDNTQTYISDVNIGTPWNPYVIDLNEMRTGISTIAADDGDDDTDWWTLQGFKIGRKPTQPGVYIHHGKKVVIKLKK
ncbi:MAG: laminin G domain-containing protein [Prevotella sp.]|nr:laminin G domain-containing protein [Prevotella sp.]